MSTEENALSEDQTLNDEFRFVKLGNTPTYATKDRSGVHTLVGFLIVVTLYFVAYALTQTLLRSHTGELVLVSQSGIVAMAIVGSILLVMVGLATLTLLTFIGIGVHVAKADGYLSVRALSFLVECFVAFLILATITASWLGLFYLV